MIDILVLGNDFSSYTAVYELEKRGYCVLHNTPFNHYFIDQFSSPQKLTVCDIDQYVLGNHMTIRPLIEELGFLERINPSKEYKEILSDGRVLTRSMDKASFKIYLYRHFAKEHLSLDKWFKDIHALYQEFVTFIKEKHEIFTTSAPLSFDKIKHLSLREWLNHYFKSEPLKESLNVFYQLEGKTLDQIKAFDYLLHWFYVFEENAQPIQINYKQFVKTIKKQCKNAIFKENAIQKIQFHQNMYHVLMEDGSTYKVKYILGDLDQKTSTETVYRWIDLDIDTAYDDRHFKEKIVFKETPLFKHLAIFPMHLNDPSKKGYLRIEAISEANTELLVNFISRYYPDLENNIKSTVERIPLRPDLEDLFDEYTSFSEMECLEDLFDQPKWIQVHMNKSFKPLLPYEMNKGLLYANIIDYYLIKEKTPDENSVIRQLVNPLVLKFQSQKPVTFNLKIGLREFYLKSKKDGIVFQNHKAQTTAFIKEAGLVKWLQEKTLLNEDVFFEETQALNILEGLLKTHKTFKNPYGLWFIEFILLMSLIPLFFIEAPHWIFPSLTGLSVVIFMLTHKTMSRLGLILTIIPTLFLSVSVLSGYYGFSLVVSGMLLFISAQTRFNGLNSLKYDPVRNMVSDYYFNKFNQRLSIYLSIILTVIGLLSLVGIPSVLIGGILIGYMMLNGGYYMNLETLIDIDEEPS